MADYKLIKMIDLTNNNDYIFGPGIKNIHGDYRICASKENIEHYNVLVFTDSRGTALGSEKGKEWTTMLANDFDKKGLSYLLGVLWLAI